MGNPYDIPDDDPEYQALLKQYGVGAPQAPQQEAGFKSAFKNALGSQVQGAGQTAADLGWQDNPIERYGKSVQDANPMSIRSLGDIVESPWQATKEATGMALGYIAPAMVGRGLQLAGGAMKMAGLSKAGVALNTLPAQAALAAVPSYGGIREEQEAGGHNDLADIGMAALGAGTVGAIETKFGAQKMLGLGNGAVAAPTRAEFVKGLGKTPLATMGKVMGRTVAEETGEELAQNPIEQLASYQNPLTAENINETLTGSALAGLGTIGLGGAGGARMAMRHKGINDFRQQNLLDPSAPSFENLREAADWEHAFVERDQGLDAANTWRDGLLRHQFADRNEQVRQDQLNHTVDLLYGDQDRSIPLLPYSPSVIQAEGDESQVPLSRLDELYARRNATQQVENDGSQLSEELAQRPVNPGFDFNTQNVPLPQDLGSAIALVQQVRNSPIIPGTPLHAAILRAGEILQAHGVKNVTPQVAQGSNQAPRGNTGGSAGNTQTQPGVGRGGDNVATTPVLGSGANQLVGSTSGGVGAVTARPGTKDALKQMAVQLAPEGSQEYVDLVNAIDTSKSYAEARKSLAKHSKDGLRLAIATAPEQDRKTLQLALGWDNEGNMVGSTIPSYSEIGKQIGKTRQRVQQILSQYGITEQVLNQMAAVGQESVGLSEIMPSQQEDGGQHEGTGYRLMTNPNEADDIVDDHQTRKDTQEANRVAAEMGVSAKELSQPSNFQTAAEVRAEEIAQANREAHAAKEREAGAREMEKLAKVEKETLLDLLRKSDPNIVEEDIRNAREEWSLGGAEALVPFDNLTTSEQASFVRATVSFYTTDSSMTAQRYANRLEEILDEAGKRTRSETQAVAPVRNEAGEAALGSASTAEEVVQPVGSESSSEEVTAEGVVSRWDQGAKALGVTTWDGLSSEQQNYILGSGTWEEFDEAAGEVLDEINDDQGAAKFSESNTDKGVDPQKLSTTLRKLFFSPEKFNKLVSIYPDAASIPLDVKEAAAADAHMSVKDVPWEHVQGFAMNGKVYLVAGNIKEGNELGVFLHELGVHVGMERLISKSNMAKLSGQIEQWAANDNGSKESKLAKDAVRRAEGSASEDRQQEVIAYFVEEAVKSGINPVAVQKTNSPLAQWFRSLWAAAKLALRKIGLGRFDQLSAQNIVDLSYGAAKMELTGTWHGTAADFRNFDHSYMGSGEGAQAFGWGTYLAQRVGIAKGYWEADTRRKVSRNSWGGIASDFLYDGKVLPPITPDTTDAEMVAKLITAVYSQGMVSNRSATTIESTYGVDTDVAEKAAEIAKTLDVTKGDMKQSRPTGSLMRVDTAVHDDEMLDWDKALSEQSDLVKEALYKTGVLSQVAWEVKPRPENDPNGFKYGFFTIPNGGRFRVEELPNGNYMVKAMFGGMAERGYSKDGFDREFLGNNTQTGAALYHKLTGEKGSDQAASEYLDSIGIKGIKFLDSQSRTNSQGAAPTISDVGLTNLAGKVDYYGIEKTIPSDALVRTRGNAIYVQVESGGMRDYKSLNELSRDGMELLDDQGKLDALFAIKKFVPNQTRNLVIFNDKNIQRVVSQVGANRDKVKFSQADVTRVNPQYRQASTLVKQVLEYVGNKFQSVENNLMFGHQLAEKLQRLMPGTDSYIKSLQKRQTERVKHEQEIARIASAYNELDTKQQNALNAFVQKSTMDGKWGFKPTWFEKDVQTAVDATMKTQFDALTPAAQQIIKDMFKFGSEQQKRFDESVNANITDPKKKVQRNQMYGKPYAPLKRFGDHVVVGKSAAFVAEEKANPGSKRLAEMKADPKHYYVEFTDGNWEAIKRRDEMASANPALSWLSKPLQLEDGDLVGMNFTMLEKLKRQIEASDSKSSKATKSALSSLANQLYIQQLNHLHANKSQAQRLNVKGADTDMMRAFVTQGRAEAALIANLRTHAETEKALQQIQTAAREGSNQDAKTRVANAVLRRHLAMLDFKPTPIQNKLMGANSFMMLLTSPAYYLTNATQPFVVSLPYMAGRFGGANSWNTLRDAYKTTLELVKLPTLFKDQNLDTAHLRKFNSIGREADALQTLLDENLVNVGMEMELGDIANQSKNPAWKQVQKGMQVLKTGVANVEILNRLSSAVAGYRLAYTEAINKGQSTDAAHDAGVEYARKLVIDTHGDYAGYNAPTVMMQGAFGNLPVKLMTQFKKFQFIQAGLLISTFRDAYLRGNLNPTEKAAAKAMFKWMLGTQAALAGALGGVTGVPMALLGSILAGAFGDDGEDKEAFLRRVLGGGAFAQLILHGAPAAAGVDISKRVGMGAALDPFRMADPQTDWSDYALSLAGPSAGLASRTANGLGYMGKGQYWKGLEMLMPSGVLTNASKIARYESEGLTNSRGDVVMKPEEISLMTDIMQGMGLETTQLSDRRWKAGAVYDRGIHFKEQTAKLQRDYVEAIKDGDQGEVSEIRQKWMKLQAERVKQGFKRENMTALTQSPMVQKKRERDTINGLQSTQTNKKFVESIDAL